MPILKQLIHLSRQIATSILKEEEPCILEKSPLFTDKDKEYILKNITNKTQIKERKKLIDLINIENDWKKVSKKTIAPKNNLLKKYSAAAAIFIAIMALGFLRENQTTISKRKKEIKISNNIQEGSNKAVLTLEDGSKISLEKGTSIKTKNASSNGEQLQYVLNENKKTEQAYNYLTIPRSGQFTLELSDGTKVWLNSDTQLKYPVAFIKGESRKVELIYGEAYFDVSPSEKNQGSDFIVLNNEQVVKVLGTEFNIKAYKDEPNTYTTLVEGKVSINALGKEQNLTPNQQSVLNNTTKNLTISTVDVFNATSWKDGVFSFDGLSLNEIMLVLARWYDVEVFYLNDAIKKEEFVGVLDKNQNLEDILSTIKNYGVIKDFKLKERTVVLK